MRSLSHAADKSIDGPSQTIFIGDPHKRAGNCGGRVTSALPFAGLSAGFEVNFSKAGRGELIAGTCVVRRQQHGEFATLGLLMDDLPVYLS